MQFTLILYKNTHPEIPSVFPHNLKVHPDPLYFCFPATFHYPGPKHRCGPVHQNTPEKDFADALYLKCFDGKPSIWTLKCHLLRQMPLRPSKNKLTSCCRTTITTWWRHSFSVWIRFIDRICCRMPAGSADKICALAVFWRSGWNGSIQKALTASLINTIHCARNQSHSLWLLLSFAIRFFLFALIILPSGINNK